MLEDSQIKNLARAIVEVMDENHSAELAEKWEDGKIVFEPNEPSLKSHEIPMEKFMHKVVLVRNNLRVLEQQINSNKSLSEGEKLKFQSYITKCYGSLTSMNFMFYYDKDKFSSKR
ncbi:MAG: hypothetical protein ACLFSQ_00540 [Candidatus Zixiibacteriota bacterium]